MSYRAPVKDMLFCMQELAGLDAVARLPGFEDIDADTAQAVLEECAKFNEGVVAPLNWDGDLKPSSFHDDGFRSPSTFNGATTPSLNLAHSSSTACAVSMPASSKPGSCATCSRPASSFMQNSMSLIGAR